MLNDFSKLNNQTEENTPPETKEAAPPEEILEISEDISLKPGEQPPQPISPSPKFDPYRETPPEEEYQMKF